MAKQIKIVSCKAKSFWYADRIGEIFNVVDLDSHCVDDAICVSRDEKKYVLPEDCEEVSQ